MTEQHRARDLPVIDRRKRKFSLKARFRSLQYASRGLYLVITSQHNAWIHLVAIIGVVTAGIMFDFTQAEWCWVVIAIIFVWTAEALNSALEFIADMVSPEYHPMIRNAKDAAAGAVLITAIGSVIIGILVIGPHVIDLL